MSFCADKLDRMPIVGILRGFPLEQIRRIVEAACAGGLLNLEITMNSAGAASQIRAAVEVAGGCCNVGAGTVLDLETLEAALKAGASFIVTPTVQVKVIEACRERAVPVFPGALSPAEVVGAWDLGATMVKIFPAESVGPGYIRSLKAPFPGIKLMPTGGVDLETLPLFMAAGADAFGVGSPIFSKDKIAAGDWAWLEGRCRAFCGRYEDPRISRSHADGGEETRIHPGSTSASRPAFGREGCGR